MLHSTATQWQHRFSLEVTLTEGYLELCGILSGSKSYGQEELIIGRRNESATGTQQEEVITYLNDNSWKDEIDEFARAVIHADPILHGNSRDALETMKLVFRIYYADAEWRAIFNIPCPDKS